MPWKIIPRQAKAIFAASFIFELQIYNFLAIVKAKRQDPGRHRLVFHNPAITILLPVRSLSLACEQRTGNELKYTLFEAERQRKAVTRAGAGVRETLPGDATSLRCVPAPPIVSCVPATAETCIQRAPPPALVRGCTSPREGLPYSDLETKGQLRRAARIRNKLNGTKCYIRHL